MGYHVWRMSGIFLSPKLEMVWNIEDHAYSGYNFGVETAARVSPPEATTVPFLSCLRLKKGLALLVVYMLLLNAPMTVRRSFSIPRYLQIQEYDSIGY